MYRHELMCVYVCEKGSLRIKNVLTAKKTSMSGSALGLDQLVNKILHSVFTMKITGFAKEQLAFKHIFISSFFVIFHDVHFNNKNSFFSP